MSPQSEFSLGDLPSRARLGPSISQHLHSPEPSLGKGKELLMQNKWNQSKQKAAGLILFITHPRVSNASPDSHMERGNPAGPPRRAGTGRASHARMRAHTTTDQFTLLCPWAGPGAPPSPSQPFIPLLGALSLLLGTAPVPSHPLLRDDAKEQPGHVEVGGDEEQGTDTCPK